MAELAVTLAITEENKPESYERSNRGMLYWTASIGQSALISRPIDLKLGFHSIS